MQRLGVHTIEIKTGYGLTQEQEVRAMRLLYQLKKEVTPAVSLLLTYLVHALPQEYKKRPSSDYVHEVGIPALDEMLKLGLRPDFVDIFMEENYFDKEAVDAFFSKAQKENIPRKIHCDEFNDLEGAHLAATWECVSADHLLATSKKGFTQLAQSNTTATILPGTALFLDKPMAKISSFVEAGGRLSLASDFNPGSCHFSNLLGIAQISNVKLKLNMAQFIASITYNAARALNLEDRGFLQEGMRSSFLHFKKKKLLHLLYDW